MSFSAICLIVIVGALILVVAAFIANAMQKIVVGSAKAAAPLPLISGADCPVVHLGVRHFGHLSQLGIAGAFTQTLFI